MILSINHGTLLVNKKKKKKKVKQKGVYPYEYELFLKVFWR